MEKRRYNKEALDVSLLGLGCMRLPKIDPNRDDIDEKEAQKIVDYAYAHGVNYYDTAYMYHGGKSEAFIGKALKKYPRDSYFLASKMPIWEVHQQSDLERIFQTQLQRCGVDYFDFYLFHSVNKTNFQDHLKYNTFDFLTKMKQEGRIHHIGFSFHDTPEVMESDVIDRYPWEFVQIQLNYLDWEMQNAKKQYELARSRGAAVHYHGAGARRYACQSVRGGKCAVFASAARQEHCLLGDTVCRIAAECANGAVRYEYD